VGNQELSKPVLITILAVVVIVIGALGWWYFGRSEKYPGYQAPQGGYGRSGPGSAPPPGGMPPGGAPR
jgi:hypothetical protein